MVQFQTLSMLLMFTLALINSDQVSAIQNIKKFELITQSNEESLLQTEILNYNSNYLKSHTK